MCVLKDNGKDSTGGDKTQEGPGRSRLVPKSLNQGQWWGSMERALPVGSSVCLECKICERSGRAGPGRQAGRSYWLTRQPLTTGPLSRVV